MHVLANRIVDRRTFIGGSDARIIMGEDEDKLVRLWREKRGEIEHSEATGKYRLAGRTSSTAVLSGHHATTTTTTRAK